MVIFRSITKSPIKLAVRLLVVAAIVISGLELTNTTHLFHKDKLNYGSGAIPTKSVPTSSSATNDSINLKDSAGATATSNGTIPAPTGDGAAPPYGYFVSNHHPGQKGTDTSELSVCKTSLGATCYIQLVNGSITKKLDEKKVDGTGTATWTWDVKTAGLVAGSWKVSAVALLNGQTTVSQDPNNLEVTAQ